MSCGAELLAEVPTAPSPITVTSDLQADLAGAVGTNERADVQIAAGEAVRVGADVLDGSDELVHR